jgi:flagellar biosynthesis chaperone FliJ
MAAFLQQLDQLRAKAVEQARADLLPTQRTCSELEQALLAARRQQHTHEHAVRSARETFAGASTVLALRSADAQRATSEQQLRAATDRVQHLQRALAAATDEREAKQAVLRAAAVAQRAVGRTMERRQADVSRRTERRAEDELEDSFRATARLAATRVSSTR